MHRVCPRGFDALSSMTLSPHQQPRHPPRAAHAPVDDDAGENQHVPVDCPQPTTSKRLSEQLSIASRASRDLVRRLSADAFVPACMSNDETKRRGSVCRGRPDYGLRDATSAEGSVVGDLPSKCAPVAEVAAHTLPLHSMTTVSVGESVFWGSDASEEPGAANRHMEVQPRLPPPRKGIFTDSTPDTAIMSHFVNADTAISGMQRY